MGGAISWLRCSHAQAGLTGPFAFLTTTSASPRQSSPPVTLMIKLWFLCG